MIGLQTNPEKVELFIFQFKTEAGEIWLAGFYDTEEQQFEGGTSIPMSGLTDYAAILKEVQYLWGKAGVDYWSDVLGGSIPSKKVEVGILLDEGCYGMGVYSTLSTEDAINTILEGLEYQGHESGTVKLSPQDSIDLQVTAPYMTELVNDLKIRVEEDYLNAALNAFGMEGTNLTATFLGLDMFSDEQIENFLDQFENPENMEFTGVMALGWSDIEGDEEEENEFEPLDINLADYDCLIAKFENEEGSHFVCLIDGAYWETPMSNYVNIAEGTQLQEMFYACFAQVCRAQYRTNCKEIEESVKAEYAKLDRIKSILQKSIL